MYTILFLHFNRTHTNASARTHVYTYTHAKRSYIFICYDSFASKLLRVLMHWIVTKSLLYCKKIGNYLFYHCDDICFDQGALYTWIGDISHSAILKLNFMLFINLLHQDVTYIRVVFILIFSFYAGLFSKIQ